MQVKLTISASSIKERKHLESSKRKVEQTLMSFLGDLKKIDLSKVGKVVLGIAGSPITNTIITSVNPAAGALWGRLTNAIQSVELAHAEAGITRSGPQKLGQVTQDFSDSLAVAQEVLKTKGKQLTWNQKDLEDLISMQVAVFNKTKSFYEGIQLVEVEKPATTS